MANFKVHFAGGIVASTALMGASFLTTQQFSLIDRIIVFTACAIGSISPDIDSKTSKTVRYFFIGFMLITGFLVFQHLYYRKMDFVYLIGLTLSAMVFVITLIKHLFSKLVTHRGVFHTIPMGLAAALILSYTPGIANEFLITLSFFIGFLVHLLLDEIYSTINFSGMKIQPKKSLGTAMKWITPGILPNVILNSVLAVLIYDRYQMVMDGVKLLFK